MGAVQVTERESSVGNQVFRFSLANGRVLDIEFCPFLMDPSGGATCAAATLYDKDGSRLLIHVNESGGEKTAMRLPCLWFSTEEEEEANAKRTKDELEALRDALKDHIQ